MKIVLFKRMISTLKLQQLKNKFNNKNINYLHRKLLLRRQFNKKNNLINKKSS